MARPKFPYSRSSETYEVLKQHCQPVADEYPCDYSYIHAVKEGHSNDPFPPFLRLFIPCARAGAPVEHWLRRLYAHLPKERGESDLVKLLTDKITRDAETTSEILGDIGDQVLTKRECDRILDALDIEDKINAGIRRLVSDRLAEIAKPPGLV